LYVLLKSALKMLGLWDFMPISSDRVGSWMQALPAWANVLLSAGVLIFGLRKFVKYCSAQRLRRDNPLEWLRRRTDFPSVELLVQDEGLFRKAMEDAHLSLGAQVNFLALRQSCL